MTNRTLDTSLKMPSYLPDFTDPTGQGPLTSWGSIT